MLLKIGEKVRNQDSIMCIVPRLCAVQSRVQFLSREGNSSILHDIQIGCGAHPATCSMGTGGSFPNESGPGVKATTHLYLVPRLRRSGTMSLLPPVCLHDMQRDNITFT